MQMNRNLFPLPEASPSPITDTEITRLINLRESKAFLKKRLDQIDSDISSLEEGMIARIEAGALVASSQLVSVKTSERRYPSWKESFTNCMGEAEAKKVIASTAPTVSKSVIIASK